MRKSIALILLIMTVACLPPTAETESTDMAHKSLVVILPEDYQDYSYFSYESSTSGQDKYYVRFNVDPQFMFVLDQIIIGCTDERLSGMGQIMLKLYLPGMRGPGDPVVPMSFRDELKLPFENLNMLVGAGQSFGFYFWLPYDATASNQRTWYFVKGRVLPIQPLNYGSTYFPENTTGAILRTRKIP